MVEPPPRGDTSNQRSESGGFFQLIKSEPKIAKYLARERNHKQFIIEKYRFGRGSCYLELRGFEAPSVMLMPGYSF